jgi:hypothetical protein
VRANHGRAHQTRDALEEKFFFNVQQFLGASCAIDALLLALLGVVGLTLLGLTPSFLLGVSLEPLCLSRNGADLFGAILRHV